MMYLENLTAKSKSLKYVSYTSFFILALFFIHLLFDIIINGLNGLNIDWFFQPPESAGRKGGISSILVSTAWTVGICIVVAVPIAIISAIFLTECISQDSRTYKTVYACLDLLASIPSIVFGLFGYSFFVIYLGMGFSILAGGLTLAIMVLPLLIRLIQDNFANVSQDYRLNAYANGLSMFTVYFRVITPIVKTGILASIVLAISRAISETAALLYTAGYVSRMPETVLDSGRTLSVHILDLAMNVPGGNQNSYTSALTLLIFLLAINMAIISLSRTKHRVPEVKI